MQGEGGVEKVGWEVCEADGREGVDGGGLWGLVGGMAVGGGVDGGGVGWVSGAGGPGEVGGIGGLEDAGVGVGSRGVDVDGADG